MMNGSENRNRCSMRHVSANRKSGWPEVRFAVGRGAVGLVMLIAAVIGVVPNVISASARDAATTAVVQRRLDLDPAVDADAIQVHTVDGTVYLRGIVKTRAEKRRVEYLARSVSGVRAI